MTALHPSLIPLAEHAGIPAGWYTICLGRDLARGQILPFSLASISLVAYRTASGAVSVVEDRCPHVGGSFSRGTVSGELIRCPIHGFSFDRDGLCVATGFAGISANACIQPWATLETNGLVMVFYHPHGLAPTWQPASVNWDGWSEQVMQTVMIPASVQLVTEGIADKGHLETVHGYTDVCIDRPFLPQGPRLTTSYSFTNSGSLPGAGKLQQWLARHFQPPAMRVEFDYEAWGLGYSLTLVRIPALGIEMRNFVNPTPVDGDTIKLFYSMALGPIPDRGKIHPLMRLVPEYMAERIMLKMLLKGFSHDLDDDILMWSNMKSLARPQLCKADGPFNQFRKWATQFYG